MLTCRFLGANLALAVYLGLDGLRCMSFVSASLDGALAAGLALSLLAAGGFVLVRPPPRAIDRRALSGVVTLLALAIPALWIVLLPTPVRAGPAESALRVFAVAGMLSSVLALGCPFGACALG